MSESATPPEWMVNGYYGLRPRSREYSGSPSSKDAISSKFTRLGLTFIGPTAILGAFSLLSEALINTVTADYESFLQAQQTSEKVAWLVGGVAFGASCYSAIQSNFRERRAVRRAEEIRGQLPATTTPLNTYSLYECIPQIIFVKDSASIDLSEVFSVQSEESEFARDVNIRKCFSHLAEAGDELDRELDSNKLISAPSILPDYTPYAKLLEAFARDIVNLREAALINTQLGSRSRQNEVEEACSFLDKHAPLISGRTWHDFIFATKSSIEV